MSQLLSLIIGALMPIVISLLKDSGWSQALKTLTAMGVCVVVAALQVLGTAWVTHTVIQRSDWVTTAGLVFSAATASYKIWFQGTSLDTTLTQKKVL